MRRRLRRSVKINPDYERAILRCLEQVGRRYQSMGELASDVAALRDGRQTAADTMSVTERDALVLGTIISECEGSHEATLYKVEQSLAGRLHRFQLAMSKGKLLKLGFVTESHERSDYGVDTEIQVTEKGMEYAIKHQDFIERQVPAPAEEAPAGHPTEGDDDIPF